MVARRERLMELARLGARVQRERTDEAVLAAVGDGLSSLGLGAFLLRPAGESLRLDLLGLPRAHLAALEAAGGRLPPDLRIPWPGPSREAWREGISYAEDVPALARQALGAGTPIPEGLAAEKLTRAVAVRVDVADQPYALLGAVGSWPRPEDLPAFRLFGAQVSAALDAARAIRDLSRRNEELAALNRLAETAATSPDLPAFFARGSEELMRSLRCDGVAIWLLDEARRELELAFEVGATDGVRAAFRRMPVEATTALGRVLADGVPRLIQQSEYPPHIRAVTDQLGFRSHGSVPLRVRAKVVGVMNVGWREPQDAGSARLELLQAMGGPFAAAVEAQRLLADLRGRVSELTLLNQLSLSVFGSGPGDVTALLQTAAGEIGRALRARSVAVMLLHKAEQVLRSAAGWGAPLPADPVTIPIRSATLAAAALETQAPVWSADTSTDPRSGMRGVAAAPPMSLLIVPLTSRRGQRGVVAIAAEPGRRFAEAEVALAFALATTAASGLENSELHADLKRSYAELARTQAQLVQRERLAALGELSAVVAHEVRNPLGVIFNSLGSLRRLLRPEGDARMLLDIVGEEADRLNRIVGDLLDFARPSTPALRPEALERLLEDAVAAAVAENRDIAVERDIEPELPPVSMDARLIRQAVLNVAVNAVQAMPRGGKLTVRARRDGGWARVEIRDSGPGIPDEIRHRVFEPFFTTKASGTGLGLAVVKRIVEGHGGEVAVASDPGAGAAVTIRIPLEPGEPVPSPQG